MKTIASICKPLPWGGVWGGLLLLLASCISYDDATTEITARVQLAAPAEFVGSGDLGGRTIVLSQNGQTFTAQTNQQGMAEFTGLVPDVYNISCSWEINADDYRQLAGKELEGGTGCTISGSLNAHLIKEEQTIQLETNLAVNRDIVIGKIYYAGSKDNNNRTYMAGKYVELYNNGNSPVDVAGYYIGLVEAESNQAYTLDNLHEAYQDSVVLLKQVFRIPASAPFMVPSGGTVVLANSAIDHRPNNDMERDLTDADFEAKDVTGRTQNNPATPALELIYSMYAAVSNMNLVQSGPCGVVLFRTDDDVAALPRTYGYGKQTGSQWLVLPKRHIIDGVEVLRNTATGIQVSTKRLYADIDAGYTFINAISGWNGEVVYRRTARLGANGQKVLMDTNNSSNDFTTSATIRPREYDTDAERPND